MYSKGQQSQRNNGDSNRGQGYQTLKKDNLDIASDFLYVESKTTCVDSVHNELGDRRGMSSRDNSYRSFWFGLDESIMSRNHLNHQCYWKLKK